MSSDKEKEAHSVLSDLSCLLNALSPYSSQIVLAGGLVPFLYRMHPRFDSTPIDALHTKDIDLTVPGELSSNDKPALRDLLDSDEFNLIQTRQTSFDVPPKHFVQHARYDPEKLAPIHAEFLAPLKGSSTTRKEKPKSPFYLEDGLTAERLRYLDLLLCKPIRLSVDASSIPEASQDFQVQLPRPLNFILQKILSCDRRSDVEKEYKDYAYIYDVVLLSRPEWKNMASQIEALKEEFHEKWINRAGDRLQKRFESASTKGTQGVGRLYASEQVKTSTVVRVMDKFLDELDI